ncbi:hypothetical protein [Leifsonia sp. NPDC058230]|uniref:hypothetical protein n=1 Tax=Leifsonia sp. NPDC058230 TaxID=3346391 RepID=UPI0036DD446A
MKEPSARVNPSRDIANWPNEPIDDPVREVARRFVLNLLAAMGEESRRSIAMKVDLDTNTLKRILNGDVWPDMNTIAKLEDKLEADLWPGRIR